MFVYLQKPSVSLFYPFKFILSDFFTHTITAKYLRAPRCMCVGGLPKIREDKDLQLSHPHFLFWVPLCWWWQGGFWSGLLCHLAASSFYAAIFLPLHFAYLCSMNLRQGFFAHYFHFPILGVFSAAASPPFGTRGRRKVPAGRCDRCQSMGLPVASHLCWALAECWPLGSV